MFYLRAPGGFLVEIFHHLSEIGVKPQLPQDERTTAWHRARRSS